MIEYIIEIDKALFIYLNNLGVDSWDFFWIMLSNRNSIFLFVSCVFIFHCYKNPTKWFYILFPFIICVGLVDFLHVELFKNVFMRLRPCWESDILPHIRANLVDCGGQYGFISGHASNAAAIATFFIFSFHNMSKYFKYFLWVWVLLVSYSRIYLAKHYPMDVLCGIIFGFLIAFFVFQLHKNMSKKMK